jgi:hypothetical protein
MMTDNEEYKNKINIIQDTNITVGKFFKVGIKIFLKLFKYLI